MRVLLAAAAALWVAGIALVVLSVVEGEASVWLIVIVPVVTGSSATFVAGVALLIAGFVTLMLAFAEPWPDALPPRPAGGVGAETSGTAGGAGGLVLIGPVPIVFGSWRGISRRQRWLLALVGAMILIVVLLAAVWLLR